MHAREQRRLSLDQIARILRFLVYFREEASPHDEHKKDKRITFQLLRMRKYSNGIARDVCIHTTLFISNDGNVFIDGGADPTRVTNRRVEFDEEDATALFHSSFLLRSANKNSKCFVSLNRFRPLFFFFLSRISMELFVLFSWVVLEFQFKRKLSGHDRNLFGYWNQEKTVGRFVCRRCVVQQHIGCCCCVRISTRFQSWGGFMHE